jgi:hypothetical protein
VGIGFFFFKVTNFLIIKKDHGGGAHARKCLRVGRAQVISGVRQNKAQPGGGIFSLMTPSGGGAEPRATGPSHPGMWMVKVQSTTAARRGTRDGSCVATGAGPVPGELAVTSEDEDYSVVSSGLNIPPPRGCERLVRVRCPRRASRPGIPLAQGSVQPRAAVACFM